MNDNSYPVSKEDFSDVGILQELKQYAQDIDVGASRVFDDLLDDHEVQVVDVQRAMDPLVDEVTRHLSEDGVPDSKRIARLEDLLTQLGNQL